MRELDARSEIYCGEPMTSACLDQTGGRFGVMNEPTWVTGVFSNSDLEIDVDGERIGKQRMRQGMIGLRGEYLHGD